MGKITLISGGARSGKSAFALKLASEKSSLQKLFIATAVVFDDEMRLRVEKHKQERGSEWETIESPYELPQTVEKLPSQTVAVVDCLSVWLGNVWYKYGDDDKTLSLHIDNLQESIQNWKTVNCGEIILVTNEVGWGIIPSDAATRRYRDWAGRLNQHIGKVASEVYLCVCGIPMKIK
ncbi:MAG: bifunctional adenosylcobinamide kinase/adenosylcobinamide-phosphate guanylyltransferase [Fibrobacter sp.]|jgi:adenosylcobinamide kinase/adenosylcobinamide-phosphate guanylyltransferase|nr:bifunctional adenosylcobinamide kinase/adenosylcobinamide-phosphate guanylyltransferase [Fibrobacter sp.]